MQPAAPTLATQADIAKAMQPQNMILPANKKTKKYATQVPVTKQQQQSQQQQQQHSTSQPQFQINKAYNVVSILKTTATTTNAQQASAHMVHQTHLQQQSHQHQQSYANVVNRPLTSVNTQQQQSTTVICSGGNIMAVNNCQLNLNSTTIQQDLNTAAIYNLTGHRAAAAATCGGNNGIIETNCRLLSDISKSSQVGPNNSQQQQQQQLTTVAAVGSNSNNSGSNNINNINGSNQSIITLANSHGLTLGSSNNPSAYMHDKNLLGTVGVSVGVGINVSCIDNRKYDYKNNNLLSNSNFQQTAQEYVSTGNNSSGNSRSNQQIYRGPQPASNAPRGNGAGGGARPHVHMPPIYSNMVLQQYPQYSQRQPAYPAPHLQFTHTPIPYYPYPYLSTLPQQQPPPHSRSGVAVNTSVNLGNTMQSVQPGGPNGPLAGPGGATPSQLQLLTGAVQPGANTVIGVGGTASGQVGVGVNVGVPPMVSVMSANVAPQPVQVPPPNRRRHQHRLQIIDPTTKKNILDEMDKSNASTESDYQEAGSASVAAIAHATPAATLTTAAVVVQPDVSLCISQPDAGGICLPPSNVLIQGPDPRASMQYKLDQTPSQRQDIIVGQTPVVSAMSDAPSVEILPTSQKNKSKKIPIVSPKDAPESSSSFSSFKVDDVAAKTCVKIANEPNQHLQSDCVAQQQQQQSQLQQQQESHLQFMANTTEPIVDIVAAETVQQHNNEKGLTFTAVEVDSTPENVELSSNSNSASEVSILADNVTSMYITESSLPTNLSENVAFSQMEREEGQHNVGPVVTSSHESTPDETDRAQQQNLEDTTIVENVKEESGKSETLTETILTHSLETVTDTKDADIEKAADSKETEAPSGTEQKEAIVCNAAMDTTEIATSLINYNEGQWSPSNPGGKKQYDREQLLQLREAKASRIQPEVKNVSILPHPNLMPMFMRNNNNNNNNSNKRVQSMVGTIGGNRNSESIGNNFAGKQVSMSGVQGGGGGRSSMKGMIHVNLSLNQDVKLNETENAWRPRLQNNKHQQQESSSSNNSSDNMKSTHEKDELVRKVRGILNKLTPERFDTLVEEIIKLKIDTPDKMNEVIVLVFEKAIDEPNFSVSYARLCHRLISEVKARDVRMESGTKSNLQHFRNALLDKTEKEFTQNVSQGAAKEKKLQPIVEKIKKCNDPNEKAELEALLEEEERKIRRRSGGTVRFIGELFKISMLTGKIIYSCIDTLLNPNSEDMLECLCKLLTTVGAKFEQTPINAKESSRCYSLEKSIGRMQSIASKTDKDSAKVSSRVRFMLQDVIDLRKNKWQSTRNEAPKTMGQIEKEAKNEQLSAQYMNYSSSLSATTSTSSPNGGGGSGGSGKRDARFGDARSAGGYGGSHSQRGGDGVANMRHQQSNSGGGSSGGGGGSGSNIGSNHSNGNNDDTTWHVQTSKGSRSQAVDSNKLEGLLNQNLDIKKMGGAYQFINWNNNGNRQSSTTPTTTPSNSFAALSSLGSSDRDRSGGPRNKGSYNKGSTERDRYNDRGMHSRTGSSQGSRENSSSRVVQNPQNRVMSSSMQKSASQSKYTQSAPPPSRLSNKSLGSSSLSGSGGIYRGIDQQQQQPHLSSASTSTSISASPSTAKGVSPPPATFTEPNDSDVKLFKSVLADIFEAEVTIAECIQRIPEAQRCGFLYYILTNYLHLSEVDKQNRRYLANKITQLIQQNYISVEHFKLAYHEFFKCASDLYFDVPELWLYIHQFIGPLIVKKHLVITDLWNKNLLDSSQLSMGKMFLKSFLLYSTREVGPSYTHNIWKKFNMRWSDFMPDNEVNDFIENNKLEYVENVKKMPVIDERDSHETHVKNVIDHIEQLLKEGSAADCIIDYCNGNIVVADKLFIRGLAETLSKFAIVYKDNSYKLEPEVFQKFCIPVFQCYIGTNEDLQLECLYGVQLFVHSLEQPRGLLSELFGELYDTFVINKESLYKWRDSKDHSAGKGVAVKSVNPFLNNLFNDEAN
ncbi:eukaryotic translation initiation factor 4 gamma 1 isoform X3 [Drosophila hydei]|uniref:Eukaryotic translation initiation factor 4 gamma 1 isoform X3 n=1 Tax=Drosophila hydei TaxID=7224 RepID=A0A6J1LQ60_DROHY|nr:eukaryotic translation initiation factor 4 gamma 1 isoform X3 [Drosophila hydei]